MGEKRPDHERIIESLMEEIKELKQRPEIKLEVDEENRRLKEQLKWKMEQFKHLEEAHEKLKDEFLRSREDWDVTRSALVDEVFELKTRVESQTRVSNELQSRLELCNQALVREESKIKTLEAELVETKVDYERVFAECREAKAELENLMVCRDEEIGNLRSSLIEKEAMCKEYEYMSRKIEQENQELLASVKELQEAQIQGASSSSSSSSMLARVKSKLRNVEQKHKDKEAEWILKVEKLAEELKMKDVVILELSSKLEELEKAQMDCSSNLEINDDQPSDQLEQRSEEPSKDGIIAELKMELQECHSAIMQLKVENEEACLKLSAYESSFAKMESARVESEKLHESLHDALLEELERHKGMVIEMSENERYLKEQCLEMECELKERMQEVCDALATSDTQLAAASCKMSEAEFELHEWKAMAERLETSLVETQLMRKQVEHSLLQEVEIAEKLKQEKSALYEDVMKLSMERESLMEYVKELCDRISKFSNEDLQVMGKVGNLMRKFDDSEPEMELAGKQDKFDLLKENLNINISPTIEKFEILSNGRCPFREISPQLHLGASSS